MVTKAYRILVRAFLPRQGFSIFLISVLLVVPSGFSVTTFSFDSTVPSFLTLVSSVRETSRSHPVVRNEKPNADIAAHARSLRCFMYFMIQNYSTVAHRQWGITPLRYFHVPTWHLLSFHTLPRHSSGLHFTFRTGMHIPLEALSCEANMKEFALNSVMVARTGIEPVFVSS